MTKLMGVMFPLAIVALGISAQQCAGQSQRRGDEFRPVRLLREFSAIRNVPVISASKVRGEVQANELVLGVVVNGQARAYPINMLTGPSREIINDTLGGLAIAATW